MTPSIDETTAWDLVRRLPLTERDRAGPTRLNHDADPGVWLEVDPVGGWSTSHHVTPEAHDVIDLFLPLQLRPDLVIGQLGQSLDGRIATVSGASHYVTGTADIRRLHRLRAVVDAVVVGAGTVAADDPRLTVREVEGQNPVRVVIDPDGRLGAGLRVFSDGVAPTLVVRRMGAEVGREGDPGSQIRLSADANGQLDPGALVDALRDRGLTRVLVEGGGLTVSRFLQAGVLDRLHLCVAPLLIGSGKPAITLNPVETLDQALRPSCRTFRLGEDVLFDLDLRAGTEGAARPRVRSPRAR